MECTKPTLLIDCDDTIIDLLKAWVRELNKKSNTNISEWDICSWNISQYYPTLTLDDVYEPLYSIEFWKSVECKEDAKKYLKILHEEGYPIYMVTATNIRVFEEKYELLIKPNFPYIYAENVILCNNKRLIGDENSYLIDDGLHNLIGGKYKKILFTSAHNVKLNVNNPVLGNEIIRVHNWYDVYKLLHSSQKGDAND